MLITTIPTCCPFLFRCRAGNYLSGFICIQLKFYLLDIKFFSRLFSFIFLLFFQFEILNPFVRSYNSRCIFSLPFICR
ncbi:hypothetical protein C0J52_20071 [Blattella germanica]|nr:hypothetical protein C0J52_20071 [Blattella germanica]